VSQIIGSSDPHNKHNPIMKYSILILTGVTAAAVAAIAPSTASAAEKKSGSPTPAASASPSASASTSASPAASSQAQSGRALPFHGTVSSVDQTAKTFTIVGKKKTRVYKVTDATTITKNGAAAKLTDIAANDAVSGSAMKTGEGTFDAKSVKIGGAGEKTGGKAASPSASPDASVPKG
jgi:hypothetical protein